MTIFNKTAIVQPVSLVVGTTIFSAGDVVGNLMTIKVPSPGGGGVIRRIRLVDDDNEKAVFKLYIFNAAPTTFVDNDAFAPLLADLQKLFAIVDFAAADYVTLNNNAIAIKENLTIDYATGDANLYAYLVCTATPTYTAITDLSLFLTVWED